MNEEKELTSIHDLPEELKDYYNRILLGTPVGVMSPDGNFRVVHLLDSELKKFKEFIKKFENKNN